MNSATRRIAHETYRRAFDAVSISEPEGAEFDVWWNRLSGLNQWMQGPKTWAQLKEIAEKMLGGRDSAAEQAGEDFD
jgi:hypothetical protein